MYTFDSRVRYSECDSDSNLTLTGIVNYLQDCSVFQSNDLGVGIDYLTGHHLGWVVNYWQIDIKQRPKLSEKITIGTNPYKLNGYFGLRNFCIDTPEGDRLVAANSVWTLIDTDAVTPAKLPEKMIDAYEMQPKFDMEYTSRKIRLPQELEGQGVEAGNVTATEFDLDSNRHVNNSRYVDWAVSAMETCDSTFNPLSISRLRVEYRRQVVLGETVGLRFYRGDENTRTIEIVGSSGEISCIVQAIGSGSEV